MDFREMLVGGLAILCTIGLPLSIPIVYLVLRYRRQHRQLELQHAERMAAIERGMEVPPLPIDAMNQGPSSRSTLLPGLIWLFVGLALTVGLHGLHGRGIVGLSVWGLVPTAVGVAYLLYYFIEGRKHVQPREDKS